jgi:SAM-dependent methyltransferase
VPPPLDPAFGGRLADADVVRAGRGAINLRALRKRVQVEGFALALLQLLPRVRAAARPRCLEGGPREPGPAPSPAAPEAGAAAAKAAAAAGGAAAAAAAAAGGGRGKAAAAAPAADAAAGPPPPERLVLVDFGSGGGNLGLALAWLFEEAGASLAAIDFKPAAAAMVGARAAAAGLGNVQALAGRIEDYAGPADVVLALHACGGATDRALQQAAARRAAFVVSPCCIGKVNLPGEPEGGEGGGEGGGGGGGEGGGGGPRLPPLARPRSRALGAALAAMAAATGGGSAAAGGAEAKEGAAAGATGAASTPAALFARLARVADFSHTEDHGYPELAAAAKAHVELDRGLAAGEAGYAWRLARLPQPELTAKSDVLLGWPACGGGGEP